MTLTQLPSGQDSTVLGVVDIHAGDGVARRLRELGFVPGQSVRIVARAPFGGDPILVQIGGTRFALRRTEAARVMVGEG